MKDEEIRAYKQTILIRTDLDMSCGKKAVQIAHASVMGMCKAPESIAKSWRENGMRKIVLKVPGIKALTDIVQKATRCGLNAAIVVDAGLTQLEPGTTTAVGFEPLSEDSEKCKDLTRLTADLKLL
jgi:PTH2 family peptidyl-tRNA hydrolase